MRPCSQVPAQKFLERQLKITAGICYYQKSWKSYEIPSVPCIQITILLGGNSCPDCASLAQKEKNPQKSFLPRVEKHAFCNLSSLNRKCITCTGFVPENLFNASPTYRTVPTKITKNWSSKHYQISCCLFIPQTITAKEQKTILSHTKHLHLCLTKATLPNLKECYLQIDQE